MHERSATPVLDSPPLIEKLEATRKGMRNKISVRRIVPLWALPQPLIAYCAHSPRVGLPCAAEALVEVLRFRLEPAHLSLA